MTVLLALCSLAFAVDNDGDGFDDNVDCDDNDARVFPGAPEACEGIDNDCDGQIDEGCPNNVPTGDTGRGVVDNDGDGFDATVDCNDHDARVFPGAPELCEGIDNDCDGQVDEGCPNNVPTGDTGRPTGVDNDGDGFDDTRDCDDNNAQIFPGATEVCDGVDNDCDGQVDEGCPNTPTGDTGRNNVPTSPNIVTPEDSSSGCIATGGTLSLLFVPFGLLAWRRRRD